MSNLYIRGIAYTPTREKNFKGALFTEDEMNDDLAKKCIGLPVLVNHDWKHPKVGVVKEAYIDKNKNLNVLLHCDVPTFNEMIYSGMTEYNKHGKPIFKGLSLAKRHVEHRTDYDVTISDKEPSEISIVPVGDRPGTWITDFELFD